MTDEELIAALREEDAYNERFYEQDPLHKLSADRIEAMVQGLKTAVAVVEESGRMRNQAEARAERLEAKLAKAVDALQLVTDACDEGKLVSLGAGGMTIYAQIRRSVYNQVPAWPIEEARAMLDELQREQQ